MTTIIRFRYRIAALLVLGLILGAATYGFAAANTFPDDGGQAGEGQGAISGYEVTNINYTLDSTNPTLFESVSFDLNGTATDVYVGLGNGGGTLNWVPCTAGTGPDFTCTLTGIGVSVQDALELHVSAAQ